MMASVRTTRLRTPVPSIAPVFPKPQLKDDILAKPNYQFEKRQKELARRSKQEEKRLQRLAEKSQPGGSEHGITVDQSETAASNVSSVADPMSDSETKHEA
jgi:hypothetical protein